MYGEDFAQVSLDILGWAAIKLEWPTSGHIGEILTTLASTASKLREIYLWIPISDQRDTSHLHPNTVGVGLVKLEIMGNLHYQFNLSCQQTTHLCTKIRETEDLRFIQLDHQDVSHVAPDMLVETVTRRLFLLPSSRHSSPGSSSEGLS